jgi:hypothetical protein
MLLYKKERKKLEEYNKQRDEVSETNVCKFEKEYQASVSGCFSTQYCLVN